MRFNHSTNAFATSLTLGMAFGLAGPALAQERPEEDGGAGLPPTIELTGVVRDFKERTDPDGHPDFELQPARGFGHYQGNVASYLGDDRKPVFTGLGFKVKRQWRDAAGRNICADLFDESAGDEPGERGPSDPGAITSQDSFRTWFRDVNGVNKSKTLALDLHLQEDGSYVFDDKLDPLYEELGGFFPIEDQLLGNPGGNPDRNFHFTFELNTTFTYDADADQVFKFIGDDDVWVFINDRLVIDLGGVHGATEQYVELNRLNLDDGETYTLDFFFAERHRTQSNFRIQTNLALETVALPTVSSVFD